jgi:PTH1 family peptidyl-tRNA hydrolase
MYLVVGLQNPGAEYQDTRHNAGGLAVRAFAAASGLPSFVESARFSGMAADGAVEGKEVRALLPTAFMNNSGAAVKKAVGDAGADGLIVVYDDLDLPLGMFKLSFGRGSGGHNGVKSIIGALGTQDFVRVRIGISPTSLFGALKRPTGARAADFVLKNFSRRERARLEAAFPDITRAIRTVIAKGKEAAMNEFN